MPFTGSNGKVEDNISTDGRVQITAVGKWQSFIPYHRDLKIRCQVSAPPPAKKTAGLIEIETEVSYDLHGIKLRAQGVCM